MTTQKDICRSRCNYVHTYLQRKIKFEKSEDGKGRGNLFMGTKSQMHESFFNDLGSQFNILRRYSIFYWGGAKCRYSVNKECLVIAKGRNAIDNDVQMSNCRTNMSRCCNAVLLQFLEVVTKSKIKGQEDSSK